MHGAFLRIHIPIFAYLDDRGGVVGKGGGLDLELLHIDLGGVELGLLAGASHHRADRRGQAHARHGAHGRRGGSTAEREGHFWGRREKKVICCCFLNGNSVLLGVQS